MGHRRRRRERCLRVSPVLAAARGGGARAANRADVEDHPARNEITLDGSASQASFGG